MLYLLTGINKTLRENRMKELKVNVLSLEDAAYIAGFFDGEGCVILHKMHINDSVRTPNYGLRIYLSNTFPGIVEWIQMKVGYGHIYNRKRPGNWKRVYEWCINGRRADDFLKQIYPFLKIKRLQVEVAFEYIETLYLPGENRNILQEKVLNLRHELKKRLTMLNKRGIS